LFPAVASMFPAVSMLFPAVAFAVAVLGFCGRGWLLAVAVASSFLAFSWAFLAFCGRGWLLASRLRRCFLRFCRHFLLSFFAVVSFFPRLVLRSSLLAVVVDCRQFLRLLCGCYGCCCCLLRSLLVVAVIETVAFVSRGFLRCFPWFRLSLFPRLCSVWFPRIPFLLLRVLSAF